MLFFQCSPHFRRFECKVFLTDALTYFDGSCGDCMIDNTHVVVLHGTGKDMVPVPEMAAFADRYGFTFVAHEKIKSVELIPTREAPKLNEVKRDRLLTLPRMQKDSPPTHLICSKNGDFLRGRILELDAAQLRARTGGQARRIAGILTGLDALPSSTYNLAP